MDLYDIDRVSKAYGKDGRRVKASRQDESLGERLEYFVDYARRAPLRSVLDVGCGAGAVTHEVSQIIGQDDASYVGVDVSETQIRNARDDFATTKNLSFAVSAGDCLPFADNAFDIVYENSALSWAKSPRAFVDEMIRVSNGLISFNAIIGPTDRDSYSCFFQLARVKGSNIELLFDPASYGITEIFTHLLCPIPDTDKCQYPVWVQKVGVMPEEEYSEITSDNRIEVLHEEVKDSQWLDVTRPVDVDGPPMKGDSFYMETMSSCSIVARKV